MDSEVLAKSLQRSAFILLPSENVGWKCLLSDRSQQTAAQGVSLHVRPCGYRHRLILLLGVEGSCGVCILFAIELVPRLAEKDIPLVLRPFTIV